MRFFKPSWGDSIPLNTPPPDARDIEAFWERIAERDRRRCAARAERQKEFIKQCVREVLDERDNQSPTS